MTASYGPYDGLMARAKELRHHVRQNRRGYNYWDIFKSVNDNPQIWCVYYSGKPRLSRWFTSKTAAVAYLNWQRARWRPSRLRRLLWAIMRATSWHV